MTCIFGEEIVAAIKTLLLGVGDCSLCVSSQLITYGDTRDEALAIMAKALDNYCIKGYCVTWLLCNVVALGWGMSLEQLRDLISYLPIALAYNTTVKRVMFVSENFVEMSKF